MFFKDVLMTTNLFSFSGNDEYRQWLTELKQRIRQKQMKAALAVNQQLIELYTEVGKMIVEKQEASKWGSGLLNQLAKDLKNEFPDMGGFSRSNIYAVRQFYLFYFQGDTIVQQAAGQLNSEKIRQLVGQIPWGHHLLILQKIKALDEALFYLRYTIENNASRNVLAMQIDSGLYQRKGQTLNNFEQTLGLPQADLATQLLKDPYNFDFLTLEKNVQEKEIEKSLTENITRFLLELGKGFAYIGRQHPLQVGETEYRLDLLFYHVNLHCYVVVELKAGEFMPEYIGKLNFYLNAVDDLLKTERDMPSIGILLCRSKNKLEVEYALRGIQKPIGVSEYRFSELPLEIQKEMPTVEELESELMEKNQKEDEDE